MSAVQEQIEKLYTLQESFDSLANVAEVQIPALSDKIDNIKLPEIGTTELAKQGENPEATNSAIYNDTHNVAQFFGITAATEFTPLTTEEITNEINTLWEGL